MEESRRNFLRSSAALAGAGAMSGLAGCNSVPFLGGGGADGGPAFYRNWMYAPDTFTDAEHYSFSAFRPSEMDANEDRFDEDTFESVETLVENRIAPTDLNFDEVDQYISVEGGVATVVTGSYEAGDVADEVEDSGYEEEDETDSGYRLFLNADEQGAVGVGSDAIVVLHRLPGGGPSGPGEGTTPTPPEPPASPTPVTPTPGATPSPVGGPGPTPENVRPIEIGQSVSATLEGSDPSGYRGNYDAYAFEASAGDIVTIEMASELGDTYLILLGPEGNRVTENDDIVFGSNLNSRIENFEVPRGGRYTIIATSYDEMASFEYDLELVEGPTDRGEGRTTATATAIGGGNSGLDARSIEYGQTIESSVDADDPTGYRGNYEPITFTGNAGEVVTIEMFSEPGDPYLILLGPDGNRVAENDDIEFGVNLNSRIENLELPQSGEYTIIATSYLEGDTFDYRLSLERTGGSASSLETNDLSDDPPEDEADREGSLQESGEDLRSIAYGETRTGEVAPGDPSGYRGNYEPVTFEGSAGDVVTIEMFARGNQDPFLILLDPEGNRVAENDDIEFGSILNSRIQRHELQMDGEYTIVATTYLEGVNITYSLRLRLIYSPDEIVDSLATIVGTQSGDTALYADEVESAGTLFDTLGGGVAVQGRTYEAVEDTNEETGQFEGAVASGRAIVFGGDTSNVRQVVVYESADDIDTGDLEDWTGEADQFDDVDNISISTNGNTAVITGQIDTDDVGQS